MDQVEKLKEELHQLRVAQVSGGAPAKVAMIRVTRKNIARIFTIISQITKQKVREEYERQGKTVLPLDLRPDTTRKQRLALPEHLKNKKTPRQERMLRKYPKRKFAVINSNSKLPHHIVKANVKVALSKSTDSKYRQYIYKKQRAYKFVENHRKGCQHLRKSRLNKKKDDGKKQGDDNDD